VVADVVAQGGDVADLYSPTQFNDAFYSETQFMAEPFDPTFPEEEDLRFEPPKDLVKTNKSKRAKKSSKKTPAEMFQQFYGQFATTCATALIVPRPSSSFPQETESKNWETYSAETADDDEEAEQLQRLTSWNTVDTLGSTFTTDETVATMELQATASQEEYGDTEINPQNSSDSNKQRKRVVRFDYPIISSLRECPRPDPQDLPNLYFTEEELGQIEDDRESTYTADDVEVVCVSGPPPSSNDKGGRGTPKAGTRKGSTSSLSQNDELSNKFASKADSEKRRKRHIKSVQIYLRERSRDRAPTYQ